MNTRRLYKIFIAPRSPDPNVQNQEVVLNWLLSGSLCLTIAAFVITFVNYLVLQDPYLLVRLGTVFGLFAFFGVLLVLSRRYRKRIIPSIVLVAIFFAAAIFVLFSWDLSNPYAAALFSLAIVMAGILLGARFSLYTAAFVCAVMSVYLYGKVAGYWAPDLTWIRQPSRAADVASFAALFGVLALVSWLFNRQMEMALRRAKRSEKALKRQRDFLEVEVRQRTRELQAAQLEQIQEVYRFAELGHLSTALFHDMANHLMSVSMDIEGLQKGNRSKLLARIQENVGYINDVVRHVRRQINGQADTERFEVVNEIQEVSKMLAYHTNKARVTIALEADPDSRTIIYKGDVTRFRQIIINLLSNAIEAYGQPATRQSAADRVVMVTVSHTEQVMTITVTDYGKTIRPSVQAKIFEPFYSTKDKGMGIGLFIVKKVTEEDLGGTITLTSSKQAGTSFVVTVPLKQHHGRRPHSPAKQP